MFIKCANKVNNGFKDDLRYQYFTLSCKARCRLPIDQGSCTLLLQGGVSTKTHVAVKPSFMEDVGALAITFFLDVIVSSSAMEVSLLYAIFAFQQFVI